MINGKKSFLVFRFSFTLARWLRKLMRWVTRLRNRKMLSSASFPESPILVTIISPFFLPRAQRELLAPSYMCEAKDWIFFSSSNPQPSSSLTYQTSFHTQTYTHLGIFKKKGLHSRYSSRGAFFCGPFCWQRGEYTCLLMERQKMDLSGRNENMRPTEKPFRIYFYIRHPISHANKSQCYQRNLWCVKSSQWYTKGNESFASLRWE